MAKNLTIVAKFKAKPGKESELKEMLLGLIKPTRAEEGCVNYDLHQSQEDPGVFIFHENWTSRAHLDKHLASEHVKKAVARLGGLAQGGMEIYFLDRIS